MMPISAVEQVLVQAKLAPTPGVGGLMVAPMSDGYLIYNVNALGEPVRLSNAQIDDLLKAFPKLPQAELRRMMARNNETSRRAIQLEERMKAHGNKLWSLDDGRPVPPPGKVSATVAKTIPRQYYGLQPPNTLAIWGSELAVAGTRTRADEAMFLVDLTPGQFKAIEAGTPPEAVLAGQKVRNARVIYYDDNRVLSAAERLEHHAKSIETAGLWVQHVVDKFKFGVIGDLFLHIEDDFVDPQGVKMTADNAAEPVRAKPKAKQPGKRVQRFFLTATLRLKFESGKLKSLVPVTGTKAKMFIAGMSRQDKAKILVQYRATLKKLAVALAQF